MYNPYSLENKTILITGASSGIGQATAIECSKLGAKCIITGRNQERLQETFNQLEGNNHTQIIADLTNEDEILNIINNIPNIDGLVNNAGINKLKPISFLTKNDFETIFSVNTFAPALIVKHLLKKKKLNKESSIVVTSSVSIQKFNNGNSVYAMSKSAITTFTKFLALELASRGIRVNSIVPGTVNNEMIKNVSILTKEDLESYIKIHPLKRFAETKEIAWAIIYLLSDATKYVTGSELLIDGGISLI